MFSCAGSIRRRGLIKEIRYIYALWGATMVQKFFCIDSGELEGTRESVDMHSILFIKSNSIITTNLFSFVDHARLKTHKLTYRGYLLSRVLFQLITLAILNTKTYKTIIEVQIHQGPKIYYCPGALLFVICLCTLLYAFSVLTHDSMNPLSDVVLPSSSYSSPFDTSVRDIHAQRLSY